MSTERSMGILLLICLSTAVCAQSAGSGDHPWRQGLYRVSHGDAANKSRPASRGEALVQETCTGCHTTAIITNKTHTASEWRAIVVQMINMGSTLKEDDIEEVVRYLTDNFSPGSNRVN